MALLSSFSVDALLRSALSSATESVINATVSLARGNQLADRWFELSAAVPAPLVTSIAGCGQIGGSVSNCLPGVSSLTVYGDYFIAPIMAFVGGQQCSMASGLINGPSLTRFICQLPVINGLQPDVYYDVSISTTWGSTTLNSAVSFSSHPAILSVTSQYCPTDFLPVPSSPSALYCGANSTLTIFGSFFTDLPSLSVRITAAKPIIPVL